MAFKPRGCNALDYVPVKAAAADHSAETLPRKLHVSKLTRNVSEEHVREIFSTFGELASCSLAVDERVQLPKGYAVVEFIDREDAERAKEVMDGGQIDGNILQISFVLTAKKRPEAQLPGRLPGPPLESPRERARSGSGAALTAAERERERQKERDLREREPRDRDRELHHVRDREVRERGRDRDAPRRGLDERDRERPRDRGMAGGAGGPRRGREGSPGWRGAAGGAGGGGGGGGRYPSPPRRGGIGPMRGAGGYGGRSPPRRPGSPPLRRRSRSPPGGPAAAAAGGGGAGGGGGGGRGAPDRFMRDGPGRSPVRRRSPGRPKQTEVKPSQRAVLSCSKKNRDTDQLQATSDWRAFTARAQRYRAHPGLALGSSGGEITGAPGRDPHQPGLRCWSHSGQLFDPITGCTRPLSRAAPETLSIRPA
eukprot:gene1500-1838_t